jgi:gamma-glutamyltranspeptidase/glutathione hydrolase
MVSALVDGGVDPATAVAAPRWAVDPDTRERSLATSHLESRYRPEVVEELRARGHRVSIIEPWSSAMGHAHAIEIGEDSGRAWFAAATDPRSEGLPGAW